MIEECGKIEVAKDVALRGINGLRNLLCLFYILRHFLHLLNEERVVSRIFNRSVEAREDLRGVAR